MIESPQFVEKPLAFRPEFYEKANDQQIKDDLISFLGEYRFEVPSDPYRIGIVDNKLVDPNSGEQMTAKARKAVDEKRKAGLSGNRENSEYVGLISIEQQLMETPKGTVLWLSPPGTKEEGYGDYGFAFVGKKDGEELKMTAFRLESPTLTDFNTVSKALSGQTYDNPEEFLRNPVVLDINEGRVRDFVLGSFEFKPQENTTIFELVKDEMDRSGMTSQFAEIIKYGTPSQREQAINVVQNYAIELGDKFKAAIKVQDKKSFGIVLYDDIQTDFNKIMAMQRYNSTPPMVAGSCGMTGKIESANILGNLTSLNTVKKGGQEWFSCPKCHFKADGPVGDTCPGCGLTKDQYVKQGGKAC